MILPPAMLGVLGGGQLGRYFVMAARELGYRVMVFDPDTHSVAGRIADEHLTAAYDDQEALDRMAKSCAAVTMEFESVPADALAYLARFVTVRGRRGRGVGDLFCRARELSVALGRDRELCMGKSAGAAARE